MTEPNFARIKDYWEWAHETQNISSLTGTTLDSHLATTGTTALLKPGIQLLCIGVGKGEWVREAAERVGPTGRITAMDISNEALVGVAKVADVYQPHQFYKAGIKSKFDLALSVWVSPHMKDEQLAEQLMAVVPSLTPTGVFGLHYNEPYPGTTYDQAEFIAKYPSEIDAMRTGMLRMTRDKFTGLVSEAGGHIIAWPCNIPAEAYGETLVAAQVMRS